MKEKINLKKIKPKDVVHFRNGGTATVEFVEKSKFEMNAGAGIGIDQIFETRRLHFEEVGFTYEYTLKGKPIYLTPYEEVKTLFDIIKVEVYEERYLKWYRVTDTGEFMQEQALDYPEDSSFRFVLGYFTIMDENGRKKSEGLL